MMERRSFIKTVGGIGTATAAGGLGLLAMTGGASASVNANYGDVTITSDDGTVEYVAIYGASRVEWDGFENEAQEFSIDIDAKLASQDSWTDLHETGKVSLSNDDWGDNEKLSGPGTSGYIESAIGLRSNGKHDPATDWHVVGSDPDGYPLPSNSIDSSALESDPDGNSKAFAVQIRSTYTWYASDGSEEFSKSFTSKVPVTVHNEPKSATGSSSNSGATGE